MKNVSYTRMEDMTQEDADLFLSYDIEEISGLPDRILEALSTLGDCQGPVKVTRLEHSLQTATRAHRDNREEEYVVAALLHDIGDLLSPYSHGDYVAAILRPFVSERICWIIQHHPLFQTYYYAHFHGGDRNARDRFSEHPYYTDCVEFCAKYDQTSFDPNYESLSLAFFEPMVRRIFSQARYLQKEMSFLIEPNQTS